MFNSGTSQLMWFEVSTVCSLPAREAGEFLRHEVGKSLGVRDRLSAALVFFRVFSSCLFFFLFGDGGSQAPVGFLILFLLMIM